MRKNFKIFHFSILVLILSSLTSFALQSSDSTDASFYELLEILKNNGTLSDSEYQSLIKASKREISIKTPISIQSKEGRKATNTKWTDKIRIKGDIRTRYQYNHIQERLVDGNNAPDSRNRGRVRARLGLIANPSPSWEAGIGLTSGSSNPRGSNVDLGESFSTKSIHLDYAYLEGQRRTGSIIAGKFNRGKYLWNPTDLMWDSDIKPEGVSAHFTGRNVFGKFWTNSGIWILEEDASSSEDPYLLYAQIGQKFVSNRITARIAGTTYVYADLNENPISRTFQHSSQTNEDNNLNAFQFSSEITLQHDINQLTLISDLVNNFETNNDEQLAFSIGFKFSRPAWQLRYIYAKLEHDSIPDFLPDSDRFNGHTGIKGHEIELKYFLNKNLHFGLDFYSTEDYDTNIDQNVLQADILLNF